MEIYGQDFNFLGYRTSEMALLTRSLHEKPNAMWSVLFQIQGSCSTAVSSHNPTLPLADKSEATGSSSSRGKKSICFIFTKPYCLASFDSVLSKKKKTNQPALFDTMQISDSASVMLLLAPLVLGALRYVFFRGGGSCLDKSLNQNEVEMEHALVMMWNLMFAFCPAGKRDFGLVIFLFLCFFLPPIFLWQGCQQGTKGRGRKNAHRG